MKFDILLTIKLFQNQKGNRALLNMEIFSSVLLHILMVGYIYIYIYLINVTIVLYYDVHSTFVFHLK